MPPIVMTIISIAFTVAILGFLYWRMIKREEPERIGKVQALLPIVFGGLSLGLSSALAIFYMRGALGSGAAKISSLSFFQAFFRSMMIAGLPEEVCKMLGIIAAVLIFGKKLRNVYEYVLIGAAVGMGFTIVEEFLYSSDASVMSLIIRLVSVAAHMTFDMLMGEFLGKARYGKVTGKGSPIVYYVLALLVPTFIHTLYDTCTTFNVGLYSGDESKAMSGVIIGLLAYVVLLAYQVIVLVRFKKKTREFCGMKFLTVDTVPPTEAPAEQVEAEKKD